MVELASNLLPPTPTLPPCLFFFVTDANPKERPQLLFRTRAVSPLPPAPETALGRFASFPAEFLTELSLVNSYSSAQMGQNVEPFFWGSEPAITTSEASDGSCAAASGCRLPSLRRVHNFDRVQIIMFSEETSHKVTKVIKKKLKKKSKAKSAFCGDFIVPRSRGTVSPASLLPIRWWEGQGRGVLMSKYEHERPVYVNEPQSMTELHFHSFSRLLKFKNDKSYICNTDKIKTHSVTKMQLST